VRKKTHNLSADFLLLMILVCTSTSATISLRFCLSFLTLKLPFFIPWAVVQAELGWFGFISMSIFLLLLVVGFIFEWKKGALEWE